MVFGNPVEETQLLLSESKQWHSFLMHSEALKKDTYAAERLDEHCSIQLGQHILRRNGDS